MKVLKICSFVVPLAFLLSWALKPGQPIALDPTGGNFTATFTGTDNIMLCEGVCTTISESAFVNILGGTAPYEIRLLATWNPSILPNSDQLGPPNVVDNAHGIRICHNNDLPTANLDTSVDDISVLNVPTNFFPIELTLASVLEGTTLCEATITQNAVLTYSSAQGTSINYVADIPRLICDSIILPEIMPPTPGASYYTEPKGAGLQFSAGDKLDFSSIQLPNDLLDSLYVFDPSDPCESEKLYSFMIQPSPKHDIPEDTTLCGDFRLEPFSGPVTTPAAQYASSRDFRSASLLSVGDILATSQMVYLADTASYIIGDCVLLDSFFVDIISAPNAGLDTTLTICAGTQEIITDPFLLLRDGDTGGQWSGPVIADVDYNDPKDIDLSFMNSGDEIVLVYTIEKQGCPIDLATVTISATAPAFAGDSIMISICTADPPQDLFALANEPDAGGTWTLTSGQLVAFADYRNADFTGLAEGSYTFTYTIPRTVSCPEQIAEVIINLGSGSNAGDDNTATVCKGDSLDLNQLLSSNAELGGEFKVDGFLPVPDGIWDSNLILLNEGMVNIKYIVAASSASCTADTSEFIISLIKEPFAGIPAQIVNTFCESALIDLTTILTGETENGNFFRVPDFTSVPSLFPIPDFNVELAYIVEGGGSCKADTTFFEIEPILPASIGISISTDEVCLGDCFTLHLNLSTDAEVGISIFSGSVIPGDTQQSTITRDVGSFTSYHICMYGNFGAQSGDTIFYDNIGAFYDIGIDTIIDPNGCNTALPRSESFNLLTSYNSVSRGSVCEGGTTTIAGKEYGFSVIEEYTAMNGCDSIVNIIIDTFPLSPVGMITGNYCIGTPVDIFNMTFVEDTDEIVIFPGQSEFGCDSTAQVLLVFADKAIGGIDTTFCRGDFIDIDGTLLMDEGMTEIDYLPGSVAGCDSSTIVNVILADARQGNIDTMICLGQTINIDGAIIMDAGMIDIPYVPGTYDGCDSSTLVMVTEVDKLVGSIDTMICDGSIIEVDGIQIMTEGMTDIPFLAGSSSGCDSSTLVNVIYADAVEAVLAIDACRNDTVVVDGVEIVDQVRTDILSPGGSVNGCDSLTIVFLRYPDTATDVIFGDLCPYGEIEILGTVYDTSSIPDEIILSDINGCDSVYIDIAVRIPQDTISLSFEPVCSEDDEAIIMFNGTGNTPPAEIYINGIFDTLIESNLTFKPFPIVGTSGINTITTIGPNCEFARTIDIPVLSETSLELFADELSDNFYDLSYLYSPSPNNISWSGSPLLSCTDCEQPSIAVTEDTEITLTLMTDDGCTITETILLSYMGIEIDSTLKVYEPTAISFSEQGNDAFFLQTNFDLNISDLRIYDRWGNLVFQNSNFLSNDPSQGWDGRYDGTEVAQGVYIYVLEYEDPDTGTQVKNGSLTVFR